MSASVANIMSETGWDALFDGLPLMVRVLAGPSTLEEVAEAAGERELVAVQKRMARLERAGIVERQGERYLARASLIASAAQEGLVTAISRHVLPNVMRLAEEPSSGIAELLDLTLDEEEQVSLRPGPIQALIEKLNSISEAPSASTDAYTLVVVGTSDVSPAGPLPERMIATLKACAKQRSTPAHAARTVLVSYHARFGDAAGAEQAVRSTIRTLSARKSPGSDATSYSVLIGFRKQDPMNGGAR